MARSAPSPASSAAMARPRPLEDPVTMAFFPASPRSTEESLHRQVEARRAAPGPQSEEPLPGREAAPRGRTVVVCEGGFGGPAPVRLPKAAPTVRGSNLPPEDFLATRGPVLGGVGGGSASA